MRKILITIIGTLSVISAAGVFYPSAVSLSSGISQVEGQQPAPSAQQDDPDGKVIDLKAKISRPLKPGDLSSLYLKGDVVLHHNGTVITCDSAVKMGENDFKFFKNVIVNKGTTYIYGDSAEYNGVENLASVYAPIIKVMDEDATLYTYRFTFNTLTNTGMFGGGGTMSRDEDMMEADRGYYYTETKEFIGVSNVQLSTPQYKLISDSVGYNMGTEKATIYTLSYIWNEKNEMLSAESGSYDKATEEYRFTKSAYIITDTQEIWADTLNYNTISGNAMAFSNIQMRDDEQGVMGFGDYAEYWNSWKNGLLTREPSLVSFDEKQVEDTLYMSSDSMFFYTLHKDAIFTGRVAMFPDSTQTVLQYDSLANRLSGDPDSLGGDDMRGPEDAVSERELDGVYRDMQEETQRELFEQEMINEDSLAVMPDSAGIEALSPAQLKKQAREEKRREAEVKRKAREELRAAAEADKKARKAERDAQKQAEKAEKQALKDQQRARKRKGLMADSTALPVSDTINNLFDSVSVAVDSVLQADSLNRATDIEQVADEADPADTLQRVFVAYNNVRMFRQDFQAVCDSLVGFSLDSTMHMYIEPVLWSDGNQIASEVVDMFVKDGAFERALFSGGQPTMSSEVDTTRYNQIRGKTIEAFFRDNDVYKVNVVANARMLYYMQDEKTGELNGFMPMDCADMTFLFDNREMTDIIARGEPVYAIYPMDKIPGDVSQLLPGFEWYGHRRPGMKQVFKRDIRPSQRPFYQAMSQPAFPITERINKDKEDKIARRIWADRSEQLSEYARDFLKEIENNR